jgi:hypothetical protein
MDSYDYDDALDSQARTCAMLGIMALSFAMVGPCSCYVGYIVSIILGIVAQIQSNGILANLELSGEARAYGNVGRWTSLISLIFSFLILLLITLYLLVYCLFVGVMLSNV